MDGRRVGMWLAAAVALGSCAVMDVRLPTLSRDTGACIGVGLPGATLAGDPSDPRVAWLVLGDGERRDVVWPAGYSARFTPDLEVLDASGAVAYREGDAVNGGCVVEGDSRGVLLVQRDAGGRQLPTQLTP